MDMIGTRTEISTIEGEPVVTAYATLVHRGRCVMSVGRGQELDDPSRTSSPAADLIRYAGASGDFNPIHWSDRIATSVGLPGVIAHGMYTLALAEPGRRRPGPATRGA